MSNTKRPSVSIFRSNAIFHDPRVEKTAATLSKNYQVCVVGWDRSKTLPRRQSLVDYELELFSRKSYFGRGILNLFDLFCWQVYLFVWVLRHGRRLEVIHACDFDTVLPALIAKVLYKNRVVYDIFDFYAEHVRNTPEWIKRVIRRVDYWVIKKVDAVVLVNQAQMTQLKGSTPRKVEIIYNTPVDRFNPSASAEKSCDLRIAFVGTLQVERGVLDVLEVVRQHPSWHLDLAGFGGDEEIIHEKAASLENVAWLGRVPYQEALSINEKADVLFSICDPEIPNYRVAVANKVFEAMMLAKPIVVARGTYMAQIVEENQCGLVVNYGDLSEIEAAFLSLEKDVHKRSELGRNARQAYERTYHWDIMEKRLINLYDKFV